MRKTHFGLARRQPGADTHPSPLPTVYATGSLYAIGYTTGQAQRTAVRGMIGGYRDLMPSLGLTWDDAVRRASEYLPPTRARFPQYVDEMRGLADGAGVSFDAVLLMNALEEIVAQTSHHLGCTSIAAGPSRTAKRKTLVGHNEDWLYQDAGTAYLVHAEPDGEPAFLSMTYGGFVPAVGFNEWGVAQCCDSVYHDDDQPGIPRMFVARAILAARSLDEAVQIGTASGRAGGYNHLLADDSGRLCNLELSATGCDLMWAEEGIIAHANSYLSPRMGLRSRADGEEIGESMARVERSLELLGAEKPHAGPTPAPPLGLKDMAAVLADHVGGLERGICCHEGEIHDHASKGQTLASVVIDLDARVMWAAAGNPCRATYFAHAFEPGAQEDEDEEAA